MVNFTQFAREPSSENYAVPTLHVEKVIITGFWTGKQLNPTVGDERKSKIY